MGPKEVTKSPRPYFYRLSSGPHVWNYMDADRDANFFTKPNIISKNSWFHN